MNAALLAPPPIRSTAEPIPPLRAGDRLRWEEYIRRYEAMPEEFRAELIAGEVEVRMNAARVRVHGRPHRLMETWLGTYEARTPGVEGATAPTVRLTDIDGPEPDSVLRLLPECGGNSIETANDYISGAPEFLAEIGASTASRDLNAKRERYRLAGVREYVVFAPLRNQLFWFMRNDAGDYDRVRPRRGGRLRSRAFPGLWLNVPALIALDFAAVLDTLAEGLASEEHAAFAAANAARLAAADGAAEVDAAGDPG